MICEKCGAKYKVREVKFQYICNMEKLGDFDYDLDTDRKHLCLDCAIDYVETKYHMYDHNYDPYYDEEDEEDWENDDYAGIYYDDSWE